MLGNIIKKARKDKKIMQKDLADMLNVRPSAVSMWEAGTRTPDIHTLLQLSDILEIPFQEMIEEMFGAKTKKAPAQEGESKSEDIEALLAVARPRSEWQEIIGQLSRENKIKLLEYARLLLLSQAREHPEGQE